MGTIDLVRSWYCLLTPSEVLYFLLVYLHVVQNGLIPFPRLEKRGFEQTLNYRTLSEGYGDLNGRLDWYSCWKLVNICNSDLVPYSVM